MFTGVGLTHAEDVADRTTRRVAHHHDPSTENAVADNTMLAVVPASVVELDGDAGEYKGGVIEVEASIRKRLFSLGRIVVDAHRLLYIR